MFAIRTYGSTTITTEHDTADYEVTGQQDLTDLEDENPRKGCT